MLQGGQAPNIIPSKMSLVVDMRLAPEAEASEMQALVSCYSVFNEDFLYLRIFFYYYRNNEINVIPQLR